MRHADGSWFSAEPAVTTRGLTRGRSTARDAPIARGGSNSLETRGGDEPGASRVSRREACLGVRQRRGRYDVSSFPRRREVELGQLGFFLWTTVVVQSWQARTLFVTSIPRGPALGGMSGTRFSGIAVAAANRKALINQEREAALRDASVVHKLTSREEALLASLKSELVGGGGGAAVGKRARPAAPEPAPEAVRRYENLDDLEADDDDDDDDGDRNGGEARPGDGGGGSRVAAPKQKVYLSKAERKRLKKQHQRETAAGVSKSAARAESREAPSVLAGGVVKKKKKKPKPSEGVEADEGPPRAKKKKAKTQKPAKAKKAPAWPPRFDHESDS